MMSRESLIRDMVEEERPREKALSRGFKALSEAELMALIFATGIKGKSVLRLSEDILADNQGHLSLVTSMSVPEICRRYKGIGPAKAITLLAALELGSRAAADALKIERPVLNSSQLVYNVMRHHFDRLTHEEFWIVMLNRRGLMIKDMQISSGGTTATVVDVKIIVRAAVESLAESIILCHNHPSGSLQPSVQDDKLTEKIKGACHLLDIAVPDHLIFTDRSYYSYADNGRI